MWELQHYNNWTPKTNDWHPYSVRPRARGAQRSLCLRVPRRVLTRAALQNAGDNWTGPNNPFGPKIPLGAHGAFGSAPPTASGWSSGECNFNGQAQCGQVRATVVCAGAACADLY